MTANCNKYTQPHRVVVMLQRKLTATTDGAAQELIEGHHSYYHNLQPSGKLISYGHAMNTPELCIILAVHCDDDFKNIIENDPGLISGCLEVSSVVPFAN